MNNVSIECSYFNSGSCYTCNPTNEKLFTNDPLIDTKITNPCIPYEESETDAIRITIDNQDLYYTKDPFHVYKYDIMLDGYIEIFDDPILDQIKIELNK